MKIALLSRYQNTFDRGVESFVRELSQRIKNKHQVDIYSDKDADNILNIIRGDYDVVIPFNGRLQSLLVSLGRIFGHYKVLIGGHAGTGKDDIWNLVICRPDVYVALTDHMADWAKKFAWGSRVVKISNGVDLNKFKPEGDKITLDLKRPIIISVGALVWYKHHERVIESIAKLKDCSLLVVGNGEKKGELQRLGQEKLKGRFKITNFDPEEMPKVYRSCDLFTLASWEKEAFGLVYLEAMASGLGVVAPDDPSRREIIGEAGLFVDVLDPNEYAEKITSALQIKWGDKPRKQAEKFSWDKIARQYEQLMKEMIGG